MRVSTACLLVILLLSGSFVFAQDEPELTETPEPPIEITIWWPDTFAMVNESEINPLLIEQSNAFADTLPNVNFEHRLKAVGQTGGIMSTLRSATNAARGALPTLTLVRRQDLLFAQTAGYLHSMEGFPSSIQGDLNNALQLGQVNEVLYGVPYLLELQHIVYRPTEGYNYSSWNFDAVLARNEAFGFPTAGRLNSLNDIVALQYIDSGAYANNTLIADEAALTNIFNFYENATARGLLFTSAAGAINANTYLTDFLEGNINTGIFSSTRYLSLYGEDDSLAIAPIPSQSGADIALMGSWMWVLVAQDTEEQRVALDYLNWMFDTERQAAVAASVTMLPSRESALNLGLANDVPIEPYAALIDNAILPLTETEIGVVGREIQTQFASILAGSITAEEAVTAVMSAVGE